MPQAFEVLNKTKTKLPNLGFLDIKNYVLGPEYELSLVFVSPEEMHDINFKTRQKDNPTNILSFPLDKKSGEIFICPEYGKKENHLFERSFENYLAFLFIHGLVHLKGLDHGSKMENEEIRVREKFEI